MPCSDRRLAANALAWLCVLVFGTVLAACQPLPRPFQPDDKHVSAAHLNALVANSMFLVEPMADAPPPLGEVFAEDLAEALQRREVPATARRLPAERSMRRIRPALAVAPPASGIGPLRIEYRLVEIGGQAVPIAMDELAVTGEVFHGGDRELLASLAERGARRIAEAMLLGGQPADRESGGPPAAGTTAPAMAPADRAEERGTAGTAIAFHVFDVSGAPGDGNGALARAMRRILRDQGVPLTADLAAESYVLAGAVAMESETRQEQRVTIDWTLFAPDGEEIGTVTVSNLVPAGSLDGAWGPIADAASAGSAEGMLQLIGAVLEAEAAR